MRLKIFTDIIKICFIYCNKNYTLNIQSTISHKCKQKSTNPQSSNDSFAFEGNKIE